MSLVPYATRTIGGLAKPAFRYGAAYSGWSPLHQYAAEKIAGFAGRAVRKGARMAYRSGKKRVRKMARKYTHKRKVRQRIGERVGTGTSKTTLARETDVTVLQTRTLYSDALMDIAKNTSADDLIHNRQRDMVNFRGAKLYYHFRNTQNNTMLVNFAVVRPKKAGSIGPDATDFFKSQGTGTERARNFATALSSMEFHYLPINSDEYDILMHKRFRLQGLTDGADVERSSSNFKKIDRYIKINRQLRYDGTGESPTGNSAIYTVYWFDFQMTTGGSSATFGPQMQNRVISYFREPKN